MRTIFEFLPNLNISDSTLKLQYKYVREASFNSVKVINEFSSNESDIIQEALPEVIQKIQQAENAAIGFLLEENLFSHSQIQQALEEKLVAEAQDLLIN
jgi:hypothetical protein